MKGFLSVFFMGRFLKASVLSISQGKDLRITSKIAYDACRLMQRVGKAWLMSVMNGELTYTKNLRDMRQTEPLKMIDEWSSSPIVRKTISEPQTGIEPTTFWWPVRRSNHWATKTQMASQGASSTYTCDLSGSHYILIMIDEVCMMDIWELGNILRSGLIVASA